jgi:hypothetical protein
VVDAVGDVAVDECEGFAWVGGCWRVVCGHQEQDEAVKELVWKTANCSTLNEL